MIPVVTLWILIVRNTKCRKRIYYYRLLNSEIRNIIDRYFSKKTEIKIMPYLEPKLFFCCACNKSNKENPNLKKAFGRIMSTFWSCTIVSGCKGCIPRIRELSIKNSITSIRKNKEINKKNKNTKNLTYFALKKFTSLKRRRGQSRAAPSYVEPELEVNADEEKWFRRAACFLSQVESKGMYHIPVW